VAELIVTMLVVAVPVYFLWLVVVALIVRPFGIRLPLEPFSFGKRRSAFRDLTFPQYVFVCGVLCFGCGMVIVTTLSRYLEWKYFHGSSASLSTTELLLNLVTYLMAGVLYGLISWTGTTGRKTS